MSEQIAARARPLIANTHRPILIALDGRSGSGKSTIAEQLCKKLDGVLVQSDDFYAAHISDADWEARTAEERARDAIDWKRLRREVLEPLLANRAARWRPFDFVAGPNADGTYNLSEEYVERTPNDIIVLDGAYSARPELSDLIDVSVLVDIPDDVRRERLAQREEAAWLQAWHERWDEAEAYYFTRICPPSSFDLVVYNE